MDRRSSVSRRAALAGLAASAMLPRQGRAQTAWPDRNLRLIVPYPAGGSVDVLFRILAEQLKHRIGQAVVVENRAGASGNTGIDAVAKSAADGGTIGAATVGHFAINPFLFAAMPFEAERDLVVPSLVYEMPNVAVVSAKHVPARTLAEFIRWAKAQPQGISIGHPGVGTSPQLSGVLFAERAGLNAIHVPFKGAAQTIPAMLSGDVTFAIDNLASYMPQIEAGTMRALAVTSGTRWPTLPEVPTMAEAGVADFVVTSWAAYVMPIATPRAIVERLSAAHREIAADPAVQRRFLDAGGRLLSSSPDEALAFARKERAMWRRIVATAGLKPQ